MEKKLELLKQLLMSLTDNIELKNKLDDLITVYFDGGYCITKLELDLYEYIPNQHDRMRVCETIKHVCTLIIFGID